MGEKLAHTLRGEDGVLSGGSMDEVGEGGILVKGGFEIEKIGHGIEEGQGLGDTVGDVGGRLANMDVLVGGFGDIGFGAERGGEGDEVEVGRVIDADEEPGEEGER